jgi:hypothetical protein
MAGRLNKPIYLSLICFLVGLCLNIHPAYAESEVITLQHRMPEELLPILTPFMNKEGVIKSFQNQLIIETNADNLANIKKIIQDLDKPAKKLLLSVSQSKEAPREKFSVEASGKVIFGQDSFTLNSEISTSNRTSREENQSLNQIQVLSGNSAMIMSGKTVALIAQRGGLRDSGSASLNKNQNEQSQNFSIPTDNANTTIQNTQTNTTPKDNLLTINPLVPPPPTTPPTTPPTSVVTINPVTGGNVTISNSNKDKVTSADSQYNMGGYQEQYLYDNLESGAIITPTLLGNQVRLDIILKTEVPVSSQDNNLQTNTVTKAIQKTNTVVQVPLGEWVYIGGNQEDDTQHATTTSHRTQNRDESKMSIWVRVDKIGE